MIGILRILVCILRTKKKKHLKKLQKYHYDLDYLFNEHNGEDYTTELPTSNNGINAIEEARNFLMNVEVIFYVKKQMKLEKNSIKKKSFIIF